MFISELTGRALLRNMRLLAGLRAGPPDRRLRLAVCGHQSGAVAAALRALEPGLDISESGDGRGELGLASLSGASLDSVIVTQPYHSLRSRAQLAGLQAALHVEEGTLGLLWARAMPSEGWVADYSRGVASVSGGSSSSTSVSEFPLLGPAGDPLVWIDELGLTASGFQPPKHRKFIEVLEGACVETVKTGPPAQYFDALPLLHDARLALGAASPAQLAGQQAALASSRSTFAVHQHAFHCAQTAGVVAAAERAKAAGGKAGSKA